MSDQQRTSLLRHLRAERRKVEQLEEIVRQMHKALSRRQKDDAPQGTNTPRKPTQAEARWVHLLWRLMPLADVAERTGIAHTTLVYWHSRGYITPSVHWVSDVHPKKPEERKWQARYLHATGMDRKAIARHMRLSPKTITTYLRA